VGVDGGAGTTDRSNILAPQLITWLAMLMHYVLVVGFAALTAIPNQRVFNFINIPLLSEQESTAGPTHVQVEAPSSPGTI
jgi:hypothetical protein